MAAKQPTRHSLVNVRKECELAARATEKNYKTLKDTKAEGLTPPCEGTGWGNRAEAGNCR